MAHLAVSLLGPFHVQLGGEPVTDFRYDHVRALLAYLAVEAGRPHRREELAGLLWPERPDQAALENLRHALHHLQKALGNSGTQPPFLAVSRDSMQLDPRSDHELDIARFRELVSAQGGAAGRLERLEQASALYRGPFLQGFSLENSYALEEWLLGQREQLDRQMSAVLHELAQSCEGRGEFERAESYARRLLQMDPWDEPTYRRLMRLLALQGRRGAALAQYATLRELLRAEFGVEPEPETVALYARISAGHPPAPAGEPRLAAGPRPSAPVFAPFVGREAELRRLSGCLDGALAGRGRVAFVTGLAGCGKSMLLGEFARRALATYPQLVVASGACNAHGGIGDPYLPFREILQSLCGDVTVPLPDGALPHRYGDRQWAIAPVAIQALVELGQDLVHRLVAARPLGLRADALAGQVAAKGNAQPPWVKRLHEIAERPPSEATPGAPIAQTDLFTQYTRVLQCIAQSSPLLLLLDDLQWADSGSISLLFHLGRRLEGQRILIVAACRPDEVALGRDGQRHPLEAVANELRGAGDTCGVDLEQSEGRPFIDALLDSEPNRLGAEFRATLYGHTRGHALFTVELLRSLQEQGGLRHDGEGRWVAGPDLNWEALPPRVESTIAQRLSLLPEEQRALLSAASVEGELFTAEVASQVTGMDAQLASRCLSRELGARLRLVQAEELTWQGGRPLSRYRFRHQLFQRYLYDSLDAVERAHLHGAVLAALEELRKTGSGGAAVTLARHAEAAGLPLRAAGYCLEAGLQAVQLVAYEEAVAHLTRGLGLLRGVAPSREQLRLELSLWVSLVNPALLRGGWHGSMFRQGLGRLSDLVRHPDLQDAPERVTALAAVALALIWSADPERGQRVGEQLLDLGRTGDRQSLLLAHWALGHSLWLQGDLAAAREHLDEALALHDPQSGLPLSAVMGTDPGVMGHAVLGYVLWALGYPEQGEAMLRQALAEAQAMNRPPTTAFANVLSGMARFIMGRDAAAAFTHASAIRPLGYVADFYRGFADVLETARSNAEGRPLAAARPRPGPEQAPRQWAEGDSASPTAGSGVGQASYLLVHAHACAQAGQAELGLAAMAQALVWIEQTGVRVMEAEVWRMRGELLLQAAAGAGHGSAAPTAESEGCFQRALEVARGQGARWLELRAAMSLARLWQARGWRAQAHELVANLYDGFTEGHDTPDLQEARALLQGLAAPLPCPQRAFTAPESASTA